LADQQPFPLLDGADDCVVHLVAADLDRVHDREAAERCDCRLGCAAADVDDERADGFSHR